MGAQSRIWWLGFALVAMALCLFLLPIASLSTYNFINDESSRLYLRVMEDGWVETVSWFTGHLFVRPTFFVIYAGLAELNLALGLTPLDWQKISVGFSYFLIVGSFYALLRMVMPAVPATVSLALAAALIFSVLITTLADTPPVGSILLLSWVVVLYFPAVAAYCLVLCALLFLYQNPQRRRAHLLMFFSFLAYAGAHDVNLLGGLVIVGLVWLASLEGAAGGQSVLSAFPHTRRREVSRGTLTSAVFLPILMTVGMIFLHLNVVSFGYRVDYTDKVSPVESFSTAFADLAGTLPVSYLVDRPYLLILFVVVLLLARKFGASEFFSGHKRWILLVPIPVFFAVSWMTFAGSYMQTANLQPRATMFAAMHLAVALVGLAVFLGTSGFVMRRRLLAGRFLTMVGLLAVIVVAVNDPVYRTVVRSAVDSGYKFAESLQRREDLLYLGAGKTVKFPVFFLFLSHTGGSPVPYAPIVGMHADGEIARNYLARLRKIYGVGGIEPVDCEKTSEIAECFYVDVP